MAFTEFWDMHSGGKTKVEPYNKIYIEAPKDEAMVIFYNRFHRHPFKITCACCGEDYEVDEDPTLERATGYHRGCEWDDKNKQWLEKAGRYHGSNEFKPYLTVEQYAALEDVLVIWEHEIKPEERVGELSRPGGWVWMDD